MTAQVALDSLSLLQMLGDMIDRRVERDLEARLDLVVLAVRHGRADAIAYGRSFIANPDLPERLRLGAALNEPDPSSFYGGTENGYTDYPLRDR